MSAPAIRRVVAGEFHKLRELRLRALADSPHAFGSSLEVESAYAERANGATSPGAAKRATSW